MTDRSKQIIPDSNAVVRCLDPEMLGILDLHGTFILNELIERIKQPIPLTLHRETIYALFDKARTIGNYSNSAFFADLKNATLGKDINTLSMLDMLVDGTLCNLLNPDGKGWQKGKIKICFEFIPEENEPVATNEKPVKTHLSSLDEIRQLSNELASAKATEQN
jgi:hypothetical protein